MLRKGIDGLVQIIGARYHWNTFEKGTLFLFCGRRLDRMDDKTKNNVIYHMQDRYIVGFYLTLKRRANGKEHETRKKIPEEVYALEKHHLIPVSTFRNISDTSISYGSRKDNTVLYKSDRYQVPKGTYAPGKTL